ncbi:hypothetical protein WJX74_003552 [Apatococcus lobatus]|uniref:cellulase n=1 Tax=Apatococcus lobatus TaxID=904363 RepID=A0AAW1R020_9CHLO
MLPVITLVCLCLPAPFVSTASFDASAAQRRAAFANVGAPVTNVSLPVLDGISSLTPNTTFVIPNASSSVESAGAFDYRQALRLPWQYLKAERLGKLPADNGIPWRADSFLDDPVPNGLADAGDFLVCNFPLGQSLTLLGLSLVEFGEGYAAAGATADALDALRWGLDFLVASRVSDTETVVQVGNSGTSHSFWLPAEQADRAEGARPAYKVSPSVPGSDVQGAMAGALAVGSIVYSDEDDAYSRHLLANARDLYALATSFPGTYNSVQDAAAIYPSSGFQDDLAFAGALLHLKTNESHYLSDAQRYYGQAGELSTYGFSWDTKNAGAALYLGLLLPQPAAQPYLQAVSSYLDSFKDGKNGVTLTPKGFSFLSKWSSLRYSLSAATIGSIYAKRVPSDPSTHHFQCWVQRQVDIVLGSNAGFSYLIGFGSKYPQQPHNRGSSCKGPTGVCGFDTFNSAAPNPNTLIGAMVGGPDANDAYKDIRNNFEQNEPSIDGITSLLSPLAYTASSSIQC